MTSHLHVHCILHTAVPHCIDGALSCPTDAAANRKKQARLSPGNGQDENQQFQGLGRGSGVQFLEEIRFALCYGLGSGGFAVWRRLPPFNTSTVFRMGPVFRFRKSHAVDIMTEEAKEDPILNKHSPAFIQRRFTQLCRFNILIKTLLPVLNMDSILPLLPPSHQIVTQVFRLLMYAAGAQFLFCCSFRNN